MFKKSASEKLEKFNKGLIEDYRKLQQLQDTSADLEQQIIDSAVEGDVSDKLLKELAKVKLDLQYLQTKVSAIAAAKSQLIKAVKVELSERAVKALTLHNQKIESIDNEILEIETKLSQTRIKRYELEQQAPSQLSVDFPRTLNVPPSELESTLLGIDVAVDPLQIAEIIISTLDQEKTTLFELNANRTKVDAVPVSLNSYMVRVDGSGCLLDVTPSFGG